MSYQDQNSSFKIIENKSSYTDEELNNVKTIDDLELINNNFINQNLELFFVNYLNYLIRFKDVSKNNPIFKTSSYDFLDLLRRDLMIMFNNCSIFKNIETGECNDIFKIYKKSKFSGVFTNLSLSSDFSDLIDYDPFQSIEDLDGITPMNNYSLYESILGDEFTLSYSHKDEDIIFSTKKGDGDSKWDSQESLKVFAMNYFKSININFDKLKAELNQDKYKQYRLIMRFKTKNNSNTFIKIKNSVTLMDAMLVTSESSPIDKTKSKIDEIITKIKNDEEVDLNKETLEFKNWFQMLVKITQNF